MTSPEILQEAAQILTERREAYGDPAATFNAIAARWSLTLGHKVTAAHVVLCMIDLKMARLTHDPKYRDGAVDVIGYAALLPEVTQ